jgi:hypothetical protein
MDEEVDRWISDLGAAEPELREQVRASVLARGEAAVPALCRALRAGAPEQRERAALLLGILRSPASTEALCQALQDRHRNVRLEASEALYRIGHGSIPSLQRALRSRGPERCRLAAELLGRLGAKAALPALRGRLPRFGMGGERNPEVLVAIRQAIRQIRARSSRNVSLPIPALPPEREVRSLPVPDDSGALGSLANSELGEAGLDARHGDGPEPFGSEPESRHQPRDEPPIR